MTTLAKRCCLLALLSAAVQLHGKRYEANWDSLMTRPLPGWFDDAKVGVFLHWGVFSVPAFRTEWYWWNLDGAKDPATIAFHKEMYGADFKYADFGPMFGAKLWQPDDWAALFKKAGIKYVVLTSKHHEGYTNWCSKEAFNWNACDLGPHRDIVGELTASVRKTGLHMGLYHSIFEWFHPLYLQDKANNFTTSRYVDEVYLPQAYEMNRLYQPDLIWSDGDWEASSSFWKSPQFLAWLYNDSPNKDQVVVNDRWGSDNPPIGSGKHHGGYFSGSDRQQASPTLLQHKWENAFTIDAGSWGYSRVSAIQNYLNISTVLYELVSTIAYGGNILINVGPTADGLISPIFQERLLQMGEWLQINGEAVYGSKVWRQQNESSPTGVHQGVYYTASKAQPHIVYAFCMGWPKDNLLFLHQVKPAYTDANVTMLGLERSMDWKEGLQGGIVLTMPLVAPSFLPSLYGPWVFKLDGFL